MEFDNNASNPDWAIALRGIIRALFANHRRCRLCRARIVLCMTCLPHRNSRGCGRPGQGDQLNPSVKFGAEVRNCPWRFMSDRCQSNGNDYLSTLHHMQFALTISTMSRGGGENQRIMLRGSKNLIFDLDHTSCWKIVPIRLRNWWLLQFF